MVWTIPACALLVLSLCPAPQAAAVDRNQVVAQTIIHENGNKTESRRNPQARVLEELTFNRRNLVVARKVFELDEAGRALRGLIFGSEKKLVGRVQFGFDNSGRMVEERTFDSNNAVVRRLIFRYDASGKSLKPLIYNYAGGISNPQPVIDGNAKSALATPNVNGNQLHQGDRLDGPQRAPSAPLNSRPKAR